MWYAMFSYNLEYAEHSHYISGATMSIGMCCILFSTFFA